MHCLCDQHTHAQVCAGEGQLPPKNKGKGHTHVHLWAMAASGTQCSFSPLQAPSQKEPTHRPRQPDEGPKGKKGSTVPHQEPLMGDVGDECSWLPSILLPSMPHGSMDWEMEGGGVHI